MGANCCSGQREVARPKPNIKAAEGDSMVALQSARNEISELEKFVQEKIAIGQQWTDDQFPPEVSSLYDSAIDKVNEEKYNKYKWKRAHEIYNPVYMFCDGIEPNDIEQGALGNCYFLAVLSSLAEYPERVRAMFVTKEINDAGIYMVNFMINGQETPVVIDDHLPVNARGKPAFARSRDNELWVCLLEKAWAKLHGTYARTAGGLPCFAASHVMGTPSESYRHDQIENFDEFFELLMWSDRRHFTMIAASHGQGENRNADGIISGHAYSLISIHELSYQGQQIQLLKLRNPWGQGEWQGDWSDNSEIWTDELKREVGWENVNDGMFFIEYQDYISHFAWTSICVEADYKKYKHSQVYHSFGELDNSPMRQAFFSFTIKKEIDFNTHAFAISVLQQGNRLKNYRQKDLEVLFKESDFNIILMTEEGKFVNARYGHRFNFSLQNDQSQEKMQPGKYIVMIDPLWNETTVNDKRYSDVLVDIYAPQEVDLDLIEDEVGVQYLVEALKDAARTLSKEEKRTTYLEENEDYGTDVIRVSDLEALNCWYGYIYTENNSPYELNETITPKLDGLEVIYPTPAEDQSINMSIASGDSHLVILRRFKGGCRYGLSYLTQPRKMSDEELAEQAKFMDDEESKPFGEFSAFYKVYNHQQGCAFYFENTSDDTLAANFELSMDNLMLVGYQEGETQFSVVLPPGTSSYEVLRPISDEQTSIGWSVSFSME